MSTLLYSIPGTPAAVPTAPPGDAPLARHALEHGVTTVFCGAESDEVARVYEAAGFVRIGTIGVAETR